ncbi:MAG: GDSL-type esterase/lipase family protein [Myxococcota bacterium]|nr:GDSL-type esterase/lipase family protein [Myxococcota bacterium]
MISLIATALLSNQAWATEVTLAVHDAPGPPSETCDQALSRKPRPTRTTSGNKPPPPPNMDGWTLRKLVDLSPTGQAPPVPIEGDESVLTAIASMFSRADSGETIRISVLGASHTEADFFTGEIRRQLQDRYGDAGHGFVMPAVPWKSYRAQDTNLCYTPHWTGAWAGKNAKTPFMGVGGVTASASDPNAFGWVETTKNNPMGRTVSSWTLFLEGRTDGGVLLAEIDGTSHIRQSTQRATQELITLRINVPKGPHRITLRPGGDGPTTLLGLSAESGLPGVIVDSMGVRGSSIRTWKNMAEATFAQGLKTLGPDLVILAYGTNEVRDPHYSTAAYRSDLDHALGLLKDTLPGAACLLIGPSDRSLPVTPDTVATFDRTAVFAAAQKAAAKRHGCASWDWQKATGGPGAQATWNTHEPSWVAPDWVHFTPEGYREVAGLFLSALEEVAPSIGQ